MVCIEVCDFFSSFQLHDLEHNIEYFYSLELFREYL